MKRSERPPAWIGALGAVTVLAVAGAAALMIRPDWVAALRVTLGLTPAPSAAAVTVELPPDDARPIAATSAVPVSTAVPADAAVAPSTEPAVSAPPPSAAPTPSAAAAAAKPAPTAAKPASTVTNPAPVLVKPRTPASKATAAPSPTNSKLPPDIMIIEPWDDEPSTP